ncbi:MAG: tRNA (adenosine(37)-N6)-threonylcarbamoyltransferase complex dimerization subunit type 1 TsaB [Caldisericia bacterium]|nr:tRNA (adenosine(37)-N6)-threonylcarbamoyltransferase complex dimerization subunit type 1 TsaB [Caldisericia bacterium]
MLHVSLNTAIEPYSISLLEDEKFLSGYSWIFSNTGKNEHLFGLDLILKNSGKHIKDLNFLTILSGPGSFTGLRIGFTFAKTINYIFKIPVVSIDVFEVIKESINIKNYVIVINAGIKELITFDGENIKIIKIDELLNVSKDKIIIFPEYYLFSEFKIGIYLNIDTYMLGKIGLNKFKMGEVFNYKNLNPFYLKDAESIFKKFK